MEKLNVTKKVVKITDKQRAARMANLAKGRKKRMETIKQKKEGLSNDEYDISSNDGDNDNDNDESSSDDDLIISRKKSTKNKKTEISKSPNNLKNELDELKNMVIDLATLQKKQNKQNKKNRSNSGGTKIVVLPNNSSKTTDQNSSINTQINKSMDALARSLL